ncbi:MAG: hypothetical protein ACK5Z5_04965 [Neisseriaceae bacterium]
MNNLAYYKYLFGLCIILLISTILSYNINISHYDKMATTAVTFITITAGLYRTGLSIILKSSYICFDKQTQKNQECISKKCLSLIYNTATYIAIISAIMLIIITGLDKITLPYWLRLLIIPTLAINAYSTITICGLLMKAIKYST